MLAQILSVSQSADPPKDKMKPNLNLKWASQSPKNDQVKSLAEIQAEEQNQLAKVSWIFVVVGFLCHEFDFAAN